jgi:hypothetical protein
MAASRTRTLLAALALALVLAGSAITAVEGVGRLTAARAAGRRLEARIERLEEAQPGADVGADAREALAEEIAARAGRFYAADEMNPYGFGTLIKERLSSLGISVLRYQVVEATGAPVVEFAAYGDVRAFVAFLRGVSECEKVWVIPSLSLTLREGSETADAVFRIGYATVGATGR